jgi:signal transduction histidine kinase
MGKQRQTGANFDRRAGAGEGRNTHISNINITDDHTEASLFTAASGSRLTEPLRRIKLFSTRVLASNEASAKEKQCIDRICYNADAMQNMINDLIALSRLDNTAKLRRSINMAVPARSALRKLATRLRECNAQVILSELPDLTVNPFQFQLVFCHLFDNAIKFRKKDHPLVVFVEAEKISKPTDTGKRTKKYWRISVRDNGQGFDPKYSLRVFEVFQKLHNPTDFPGSGVGLSICKKVVENHDGQIVAKSMVNEGCEVSFYLPV